MTSQTAPIEFSFESSPALARLAARCLIRRRVGVWLVILGAVGGACLIAILNEFDRWCTITGVVVPCVYVVGWVKYYLQSGIAFESMANPTVTVSISEDSIEFRTSEGSSTSKWSRIKQVWRFPDVWLFFTYSQDVFTLIPAAALDYEREDIIITKVADSLGKVT